MAWTTGANGKWHLNVVNANGQVEEAKNLWAVISSVVTINGVPTMTKACYFFDANGDMVTGWLTDANNKRFFFETAATSEQGKMATGWKQVEGSWYYFNQDGSMFTGGVTPDGYNIGSDGKWTS